MDQKTLERAKRILQFNWKQIEQDQSRVYELAVLSVIIKNEMPCCTGPLRAWYEELKKLVEPKKIQSKMKSENFELNEKEMILIHSLNEYINNDNLTDAFAVAILKEDPKKISRFKKVPENWEEFVDNFSDEQAESTEEFNQDDADAAGKSKTPKAPGTKKAAGKSKTPKAK